MLQWGLICRSSEVQIHSFFFTRHGRECDAGECNDSTEISASSQFIFGFSSLKECRPWNVFFPWPILLVCQQHLAVIFPSFFFKQSPSFYYYHYDRREYKCLSVGIRRQRIAPADGPRPSKRPIKFQTKTSAVNVTWLLSGPTGGTLDSAPPPNLVKTN